MVSKRQGLAVPLLCLLPGHSLNIMVLCYHFRFPCGLRACSDVRILPETLTLKAIDKQGLQKEGNSVLARMTYHSLPHFPSFFMLVLTTYVNNGMAREGKIRQPTVCFVLFFLSVFPFSSVKLTVETVGRMWAYQEVELTILTHHLLSPSYKDPCPYVGPTQITRDNLISKFLT